MSELDTNDWDVDRYKSEKLRYYNLFKFSKDREEYLQLNLSKYQRSLLAQFRCGILPLEIEVGRYRNENLSDRICRTCKTSIEDEIHFLCECPSYADLRPDLFSNAFKYDSLFHQRDNLDKFVCLMSNCPKAVSSFIFKAISRRRKLLYVVNR